MATLAPPHQPWTLQGARRPRHQRPLPRPREQGRGGQGWGRRGLGGPPSAQAGPPPRSPRPWRPRMGAGDRRRVGRLGHPQLAAARTTKPKQATRRGGMQVEATCKKGAHRAQGAACPTAGAKRTHTTPWRQTHPCGHAHKHTGTHAGTHIGTQAHTRARAQAHSHTGTSRHAHPHTGWSQAQAHQARAPATHARTHAHRPRTMSTSTGAGSAHTAPAPTPAPTGSPAGSPSGWARPTSAAPPVGECTTSRRHTTLMEARASRPHTITTGAPREGTGPAASSHASPCRPPNGESAAGPTRRDRYRAWVHRSAGDTHLSLACWCCAHGRVQCGV